MAKNIRLPKTNEEKVAEKLAHIVKDSTIDLDTVGWYLARIQPSYLYNRLRVIAESAEQEREMEDVRRTHDPLF